MRGTDAQARKPIEHALENHVRQRDGGFQRVADRVAEPSLALQPIVLGRAWRSLRMHEQGNAEFLHLGPERIETRRTELLALDAAADRGAAHAQLPDVLL